MRNCTERRAAVAASMSMLAELRSSDVLREFLSLLDVLAEDTLDGLATIAPEKLQFKQGVLAQLRALHTALSTLGPHSSPFAT